MIQQGFSQGQCKPRVSVLLLSTTCMKRQLATLEPVADTCMSCHVMSRDCCYGPSLICSCSCVIHYYIYMISWHPVSEMICSKQRLWDAMDRSGNIMDGVCRYRTRYTISATLRKRQLLTSVFISTPCKYIQFYLYAKEEIPDQNCHSLALLSSIH